MTDENIKGLIAKAWKDETIDLEPGRYYCDEVLTVRVTGTVEKKEDDFAAPTVSIPLIPTLALFWEKCGITRDAALRCSEKRSRKPCSMASKRTTTSRAISRTWMPPSRQCEPT